MLFFLVLAGHGAVIAAPAAPPEETAAAHLASGNRLFEAGDFAGAATEYRAGFAVYPRASLLFNIGLAELRRERLLEAAEAFEGVLARPDAAPEVQAETREQLDKLHRKLALLQLQGTPGAALAVDGSARGILPLPGPLRLLPGVHRLDATREGHQPFRREISAAPGARLSVDVTLLPLPPPPPPRPRYWLWGTLGAALVAGAVIGFLALRPGDACAVDQCIDVRN